MFSLVCIGDRLWSGESGDRILVHNSSLIHPITSSMDTGGTGGDEDHSPPTRAVVKNARSHTITHRPPAGLCGVQLQRCL
jgi:hypothetical protein